MQPEQNNPQTYLDQIAPVQTTQSFLGDKFGKVFLILGLVSVLVVILVIVASIFSGDSKNAFTKLSVQLTFIEKVTNDSKSKIKNNKLRSINSEVAIFTSNIKHDLSITAPEDDGEKRAKALNETIAQDKEAPITEVELRNAALNNNYDRAYIREVIFHLTKLSNIIKSLPDSYEKTDLVSAKNSALRNIENSIETLQNHNNQP